MARPDRAQNETDEIDELVSSFLTELNTLSDGSEPSENEKLRNKDDLVLVRAPRVADEREAPPPSDIVASEPEAEGSKPALPPPAAPAVCEPYELEVLKQALRPHLLSGRTGVFWGFTSIVLLTILAAILAIIYVYRRANPRTPAGAVSSSGTTASGVVNRAPAAGAPTPAATVEPRVLPAGTPRPAAAKPQESSPSPSAKPPSNPSAPPASNRVNIRTDAPAKAAPSSRAEAKRPDIQPPAPAAAVPPSVVPREPAATPSTDTPAPAKPVPAKATTEAPAVAVPASSNVASPQTAAAPPPQEMRPDTPATNRPAEGASPASKPADTGANPAVTAGNPIPAVAIKKVTPTYPAFARQSKTAGKVEVDAVIDPKGVVVSATAVSGPAPLREAATEAVRKWLFRPASLGGVSVQSTARITIIFNMNPEH